jgi:regulator of sigma E protease
MLAWLAPVVVFGLVIFVHELGHFLAAKWAGVYAPRFSIGFGPALWRRRRGETEYIIAAIPLGGYVRMASKEDHAAAFIEGGPEEPRARGGGDITAVSEAAPAAADEGSRVADARQPAAPPAERPRDWDPDAMIPFGPKPIPPHRWFESKPLWKRLIIMLAGVTMNALLAIVVTIGIFAAYGRPHLAPVVGQVITGSPAEAAGLRTGDTLLTIDGVRLRGWPDISDLIADRAGQRVVIDVARDSRRQVVVTPAADTARSPLTGRLERVGRIGIAPGGQIEHIPVGPVEAVTAGTRATFAMTSAVLNVVRALFTGDIGVETLGGPIRIAQVSVEAGRAGFESLLTLIAFISINLAVLNLLPIPVLDGGHIVLQLVEAARGKPFGERTREWIMRFGLAFIALLILTVMYNDIRALLTSFFRPAP